MCSELVNVAGAIDGTHIKIIASRENALDHFSRCQQHDFIIQAVVDGGGASLSMQCVVFRGVLTMLEYYEIAN